MRSALEGRVRMITILEFTESIGITIMVQRLNVILSRAYKTSAISRIYQNYAHIQNNLKLDMFALR